MQSQLNNLLINLSEPKPYTRLIQKDEDYYLKASIFKQSSRLVYRSTLSFWDVEKICKHTNVKPEGEEQQLIDITNVKNRYLEPKHGNEIINYITNNIDNFILPNLTSLTDKPFTVCKDVNSNELYTEVFEELKQANGYLEAYIKIPVGTTFSISDGNHRTYAIHQLVKKQILNPQIDGLYIGIDFYLEDDEI
ncbi:MAG: DNA sulfur modification protein DndB, partial [Turicibacter sp.]